MLRIMLIGIVLTSAACSNFSWNKPDVPETSRTGAVHDVRVGLTDITPQELAVNVGDEIRFLNDRTQPVRIVLIDAGRSIACRNGFNGRIDQEAQVNPGQ